MENCREAHRILKDAVKEKFEGSRHPSFEFGGLPDDVVKRVEANKLQLIVWTDFTTRKMVDVRDGMCYEWRYGETETVFCKVSDVQAWRFCGVFDY